MTGKRRRLVLPFSGFYESIHSDAIDLAIEMMFWDEIGGEIDYPDLYEKGIDDIDWKKLHEEYAASFAEQFSEEMLYFVGKMGTDFLSSMKFEELHSPREYNFSTDRIFVTISEAEAKALHEHTDKDTFRAYVKEYMKPEDYIRKGYKDDIDEWPDFENWDHNEMGMLLAACLLGAHEEGAEHLHDEVCAIRDEIEETIMDSLRGNGQIDECVLEAGGETFMMAADEASERREAAEQEYEDAVARGQAGAAL